MRLREGDRVRVSASIGRSVEATVASDWDGAGKVQVVLDGRTKPVDRDAGRVRLLERPAPKAPTKAARPSTRTAPPLRAVPKPAGPYRSRAYLDFVTSKPCIVPRCGAKPPSDPHHWASERGIAQKVDDTRTVPLCRAHHDHLHSTGSLPNLDAIATRLFMLDRQVALLTEWVRLADERGRARRAG